MSKEIYVPGRNLNKNKKPTMTQCVVLQKKPVPEVMANINTSTKQKKLKKGRKAYLERRKKRQDKKQAEQDMAMNGPTNKLDLSKVQ